MAEFDWESAQEVPSTKPAVSEKRKVLEQAAEGPLGEVVSALPWAQAATGFAPLVGQPSGYGIDSSQAMDSLRRLFGLSGQQPETVGGKAVGAGLKALTSPSTYSTAPLFGMVGPASTAITAAGGAAGAEIGQEYLGLPGAIFGGLVGGAPGQMVGTGKRLFSEFQAASQAGGALNDFANTVGGKRAAGVAQKAFESDSNLAANLLRAREIEQLTGVKLPTSAASGGSNVLIQEMRSQAAQNPQFLDAIRQQEAKAQKDILARAAKLFGEPSAERVIEATKNEASAVKSLSRRIADIDSSLGKLTAEVENVDPTRLGNQITNLVKAKEATAREAVSPLYENALTAAEGSGVKLNPDQTQSIYDFVQSSVNRDTFKTFPAVYGKVLSKFKPETLEDGTEIFKEASVRDLDSLKREVNKALRGPASQDTRRILLNLRNQVGTVVDELPQDFADAYRGADAEYLRRVGIPFEAKAIDDIGGKGFVEQTVPVLTKNPSALQQFIDVAGKDGQPIIRDAFMYDLAKAPNLIDPKTGGLNTKLLDKFLNQNRDTLKLVPDVQTELNALRVDTKQLIAARNKVDDLLKAENIREADSLFNKVSNQRLNTVLDNFLAIPTEQTTIMNQLNKNPEAMKGFRAALTDKMLQGGSPLEFYTANQKALDKLYGPTYTENIKALAEAAQALASNPVKLNVPISTIRKTKFEEATGMSPESTVALARRQITSNFQKVTIGLSKFFQNQANEAERKAIQEFLQDPKQIQKAAEYMKEINMTQDLPKARQLANKFAAEISRRGAYATKLGLDAEIGAMQPKESQQPEQVDMEFSF
jgi:hypothetical protein